MAASAPGREDAAGLADIAALQSVLAAENAAIYGYGLAGAQLTGGLLSAAQQDWTVHRVARATLLAMITERGAAPRAAAVAYRPPFPVNSAGAAVSLAAALEDGVVRAYLGLVALEDQALRTFGAQGTRAAAIRAASWRGSTTAFPGLPGQRPEIWLAERAALGRLPPCRAQRAQVDGLLARTRTIAVAAVSRPSVAEMRSAHDHQNHQVPSPPQPA